jgi:hypothetical protein
VATKIFQPVFMGDRQATCIYSEVWLKNTMAPDDTAQALTIIGIVINGFFLLFMSSLILIFPWIIMIGAVWLLLGIILPIIAYKDIPRGSQGPAGALLLISGIFSLIFIFVIGGILLIVAGALIASWNPYEYPRHRVRPYWSHTPPPAYTTTYNPPQSFARTKKCVNCGVELDREDQYCHTCGAHVGWY